jgi:hypothetical protein
MLVIIDASDVERVAPVHRFSSLRTFRRIGRRDSILLGLCDEVTEADVFGCSVDTVRDRR